MLNDLNSVITKYYVDKILIENDLEKKDLLVKEIKSQIYDNFILLGFNPDEFESHVHDLLKLKDINTPITNKDLKDSRHQFDIVRGYLLLEYIEEKFSDLS